MQAQIGMFQITDEYSHSLLTARDCWKSDTALNLETQVHDQQRTQHSRSVNSIGSFSVEIVVALMFGLGLTVMSVVIGSLVLSPFVMVLWNLFVPEVFRLHSVAWSQALWLTMLCGFLFRTGASRSEEK